jgi:ubiquinone/menaquinone biosynthesis C-methylase UbiE
VQEVPRFDLLTEVAGIGVTAEGAEMLATRYGFAAERAAGTRVLEIGCAAGVGFGLLLARTPDVFGADYSYPLLRQAHAHYGNRVPLLRCTAQALPYRDASFDLVLLYEAAYYIPDLYMAAVEIQRVLAPGGTLIIVSANPERDGFIASPYSTVYYTASEYAEILTRAGMRPQLYGAFETGSSGRQRSEMRVRIETKLRNAATAMHLIPRTLRGRTIVKRMLGKTLIPVPAELPAGFARMHAPVPIGNGPNPEWKVVYVTGTRD